MDPTLSKKSTVEKWQRAAVLLHKLNAIQFGEFVLASGKTSPYYVDLRLAPSYPDLFNKLANLCVDLIKREIDRPIYKFAGVPHAGLSLATLVSFKLKSPLIFVRKEKKTHGRMKMVEGLLERGDRVVLIDDLATTGGSILDAANAIRAEGGVVEDAVVILDREEGAKKMLEANNVHLHACMGIGAVVKYLRDANLLDEKQYSLVTKHLEQA
ncbi:MAG: orotate phosphoribosyltransferase [Hadesarchaea archaeon]|nr:orotate phosphoribosyltransferase [Hadesarchaea archaeon]MDH5685788.1 orotate phosphoribosyltransferase [Hadesarchaea archaeon]